jgi:Ca-activated chloride channel family protein
MSLERPWLLPPALLAVLFFVAVYHWASARRVASAHRYSNLAFFVKAVEPPVWPARVLAAAWILGFSLALLALCGPRVRVAVPRTNTSVVLCVDTSGSMAATDVRPTRAAAAASAMRAFVGSLPRGSAVGIVAFSTGAEILLPLSRDPARIDAALHDIPAPNGATAIGDALEAALRLLPPHGHRAVVLITDGENNRGIDPFAAARKLGAAGVPIYAVGIGTSAGALIPGTLQPAGIDEQALRAYAASTGGAYRRAAGAAALRAALAGFGKATTYVFRRRDISLQCALAAAFLMAAAFLGGFWQGWYP